MLLALGAQAVQPSMEQAKVTHAVLSPIDDQVRESLHSSQRIQTNLINGSGRDTMQSVSLMSQIQDGAEETETIEQRLRMLGEMPSSSSGGTLGRVKGSEETTPHLTSGNRSGGHHSLRDGPNGSTSQTLMGQTMMGSGIFEFQEQSQFDENVNHHASNDREEY